MLLYFNNEFVEADKALLPVQDRGFRFGDGVFETIRVHQGVPYQWPFHMERLQDGLDALRITYDIAPLKSVCATLLTRNRVVDGMLRIAISRGVGSRGYLPLQPTYPTLVIETQERPKAPEGAVKLWLSTIEKISPRALPVHCKLAQGVNSTLARLEAAEHQCFDGLQLNAQGHLCETSSANVFWLKSGRLFTPALECGALNGAMRSAVLRFSPWPCTVDVFTPDALKHAEAVLITNSALGIVPVSRLEPYGWSWDSVATSQQLSGLLEADLLSDTTRFRGDLV